MKSWLVLVTCLWCLEFSSSISPSFAQQVDTSGMEPRLKAALIAFYARCGPIHIDANPDRRFAHWIDGQKPGWHEYPTKEEPWNQWDGSFEGADAFLEPNGMLIEMWAGSDSGDWGSVTEYCFGDNGKLKAAFTHYGEVPEEQLTFVEKQRDDQGHFRVIRSECYPTGAKSAGNCAATRQNVMKNMKLYFSIQRLPFAMLLSRH